MLNGIRKIAHPYPVLTFYHEIKCSSYFTDGVFPRSLFFYGHSQCLRIFNFHVGCQPGKFKIAKIHIYFFLTPPKNTTKIWTCKKSCVYGMLYFLTLCSLLEVARISIHIVCMIAKIFQRPDNKVFLMILCGKFSHLPIKISIVESY